MKVRIQNVSRGGLGIHDRHGNIRIVPARGEATIDLPDNPDRLSKAHFDSGKLRRVAEVADTPAVEANEDELEGLSINELRAYISDRNGKRLTGKYSREQLLEMARKE